MSASKDRLVLGGAALLSIERAAELLPMRDAEARATIEASGIVRRLGGRRVVLWSDCLTLAQPEADAVKPPTKLIRGRRVKL